MLGLSLMQSDIVLKFLKHLQLFKYLNYMPTVKK